MDSNSLSHTKWNCKYHIVFAPKFRRKIIYGKLRQDIANILSALCKRKGVKIVEAEMCPDHVHMLVSCKPQTCLSDAIKVLKGNTARWLFLSHPELKASLWGGHLWNPSYFVATVSERSFEKVEEYIKSQKTK